MEYHQRCNIIRGILRGAPERQPLPETEADALKIINRLMTDKVDVKTWHYGLAYIERCVADGYTRVLSYMYVRHIVRSAGREELLAISADRAFIEWADRNEDLFI